MVSAAVEAIREHGPGVSVAQIAAAAGITKPVLYRHFADRADLQRAVSEHAADMLMQRIYPVLAIDAEPIEHVAAVIDAYLGMIEDEPQLYRFVVANPAEPVPSMTVPFLMMRSNTMTLRSFPARKGQSIHLHRE